MRKTIVLTAASVLLIVALLATLAFTMYLAWEEVPPPPETGRLTSDGRFFA